MEYLIAHHGHCFDGAASAALFSRYVQERVDPEARISYTGLTYEPNAPPPDAALKDGAVNVIVDYRYARSPLLTWYFDHHVSAFQEKGTQEHFLADTSGRKFHDGAYGSCTRLIADVLRARFGWEAPDMADLVKWADIVDAARFPDADIANSLDHPALAVTAVLQEQGDDALCRAMIPLLMSKSLVDVSASPLVHDRLGPIRERMDRLHTRMEHAAEQRKDVCVVDLTDGHTEAVSKFYAYKLFPTALYSVVLSTTPRRVKISVGFNPWATRPRRHDIAKLCERYGGGGHPVVGAVSLTPAELPRARAIVAEMIAALND